MSGEPSQYAVFCQELTLWACPSNIFCLANRLFSATIFGWDLVRDVRRVSSLQVSPPSGSESRKLSQLPSYHLPILQGTSKPIRQSPTLYYWNPVTSGSAHRPLFRKTPEDSSLAGIRVREGTSVRGVSPAFQMRPLITFCSL